MNNIDKQTIENEIINELKCIKHLLCLYGAGESSLNMYVSDTWIRANNTYWKHDVKPINVAYFIDTGETEHYDTCNQQI